MSSPDSLTALVADFSPPLDPALVYAILSDYTTPLSAEDERQARQTLESLTLDALAEPDFATIGVAHDRQPASRHTGSASAGVSVSELSSQLERSSLSDESDPRSPPAEGSEGGDVNPQPAGQRFWSKSGASMTSEEDGGAGKLLWEIPDEFVDLVPLPLDEQLDDVGDDPLAFLASVFPDMDLAVLEKRLEGTPYADGTPAAAVDLEQLVEDLLSQDLLTSLAEDDAKAAEAKEKETPFSTVLSKQDKRRVKAEHKAHNSFSLTSTPHLAPPVPSRSASSSSAASSTPAHPLDPPTSALYTASFTSNAWASISSHASYLSTLLHIPSSRITSTYYQSQSSLPKTLSVLLSQLAADRPFASLPTPVPAVELKAQLRSLVPPDSLSARTPAGQEDELEALLCATEGDVSDALDLHAFVADVQKSYGGGKNLAWSMLVARDAHAGAGGGKSAEVTSKRASGEFTTVTNRRRKSPDVSRSNSAASTSSSLARQTAYVPPERVYSAEDCRALAAQYLARRNEAFREAARAFQRGHGRGVGERGGATVMAEKGRMYERERRRWEEEAARRTVGERKAITGENIVDLHGLTLSQALTVVDEACNSWWSRSRETFSPSPLRIITGIGRHSRNNRAVLGPAVARHLDKEGWRWKWDDGPLVAGGMGVGGTQAERGAVRVIGVR